MAGARKPHPLEVLDEVERELVLRLVLASGSLKEVARHYGVSYPTIRVRVDRVIEKLRQALEGRAPDPMGELLADLVSAGEITPSAARRIRRLHRERLDGHKEV